MANPSSPGQRLERQLRIVMQGFKQSLERLEIGSAFFQQRVFMLERGLGGGQLLLGGGQLFTARRLARQRASVPGAMFRSRSTAPFGKDFPERCDPVPPTGSLATRSQSCVCWGVSHWASYSSLVR